MQEDKERPGIKRVKGEFRMENAELDFESCSYRTLSSLLILLLPVLKVFYQERNVVPIQFYQVLCS